MPRPTRRRCSQLVLAALPLLGAVVSIGVPGIAEGLAFLLPAVLLLAFFVVRRYPGERALSRLRERRSHVPVRPTDRGLAAHKRQHTAPRALMPRGGRLIAASLAVRPPPLPRSAVLS